MVSSTYTPTISFGGGSTGITYGAIQYGRYEQIGDIVFFDVTIQLTNKGSSTGGAAVSLPISAGANSPFNLFCFQAGNLTFSSGYSSGVVEIGSGSSSGGLGQVGSGVSYAGLTDSNFSNNTLLFFSGFYFVA